MNTVLVVLGVLGLGALAIAVFVFTAAARNYVTDEQDDNITSIDSASGSPDLGRTHVPRSNSDRRQNTSAAAFPMKLPSGEVIEFDRRKISDRRKAS